MNQRLRKTESEGSKVCETCGTVYGCQTYTLLGKERIRWFPVCDCREKERGQNVITQRIFALDSYTIGVGRYRDMTLENWKDRGIEERIHKYMKMDNEKNIWLVLHGSYGTGKTHIAVAVARQLYMDRDWSPGIIRWAEYCSMVQQSWNDRSVQYSDWKLAYSSRVLVIDDLDKKAATEWALGKLYEVVDYRYIRELPTIFTLNRSVSELGGIWDTEKLRDLKNAIVSRIRELSVEIKFSWDDYRSRQDGFENEKAISNGENQRCVTGGHKTIDGKSGRSRNGNR